MRKAVNLLMMMTLLSFLCLWWPGEASAMTAQPKEISNQIDEISKAMKQGNWQNATEGAERLKKEYQKQLWKLKLIGDEEEYEQMEREIYKLAEAVKLKDRTQAQLCLVTIETILDEIYSI